MKSERSNEVSMVIKVYSSKLQNTGYKFSCCHFTVYNNDFWCVIPCDCVYKPKHVFLLIVIIFS